MSNKLSTPFEGHGRPSPRRRGSGPLLLLCWLLFAEAALLLAAVLWLLVELVTEQPASLTSAVALLALTVVALVFVSVVAVGALRRRSWIRGAATTWQLMQIAVAVGCFQGVFARPELGWALLLPSLVVIGLLLAPGVRAQLEESGSQA